MGLVRPHVGVRQFPQFFRAMRFDIDGLGWMGGLEQKLLAKMWGIIYRHNA